MHDWRIARLDKQPLGGFGDWLIDLGAEAERQMSALIRSTMR